MDSNISEDLIHWQDSVIILLKLRFLLWLEEVWWMEYTDSQFAWRDRENPEKGAAHLEFWTRFYPDTSPVQVNSLTARDNMTGNITSRILFKSLLHPPVLFKTATLWFCKNVVKWQRLFVFIKDLLWSERLCATWIEFSRVFNLICDSFIACHIKNSYTHREGALTFFFKCLILEHLAICIAVSNYYCSFCFGRFLAEVWDLILVFLNKIFTVLLGIIGLFS